MPESEERIAPRVPAVAVPTMNPITGKKFKDEAEKQAFIDDQKAKREEMLEARAQAAAIAETARIKVLKFFSDNGISATDRYQHDRERIDHSPRTGQ